MVAFTTLVCSFRLERISTLPSGTRVYPASLSYLCRVTLLWPFKYHGAFVIVLAATPPPAHASPPAPPYTWRSRHSTAPLSWAPYTSNTLPARDCKTPLGHGYPNAT